MKHNFQNVWRIPSNAWHIRRALPGICIRPSGIAKNLKLCGAVLPPIEAGRQSMQSEVRWVPFAPTEVQMDLRAFVVEM